MFDMVAIMGRGIQRFQENGPWMPSHDLEVCDERSAHLSLGVPIDDDSPYCMIGGGQINLDAGVELISKYGPRAVVCEYGHVMPYIRESGAPSGSEVLSEALRSTLLQRGHDPLPEIVVWSASRPGPAGSSPNTRQELLNIFDLALERGLAKIAIVTVGVHAPRVATYVAKHLSMHAPYRELSPVVFESEEILLAVDPEKHGERVRRIRESKSFTRTWQREQEGISKIVRNTYNDAVKPPVVARS
jgi:hypothetical protein